ncbi:uncharacterized protein LOC134795010 [Cydia splendana]|uniref:uncharacterized protein LOC134795010 n=1 Tax=Cydia splendana TaxID=1100963 RepID=UPI00300DB71B
MNSEVVQNAPEGWGLGKTDKGWMTGEAFYEYIGNVFIPYLKEKEIALPVILFLDGHKSHLTMHLSTLCRENGIIVVALVPNTTHMMQPLDVAVFFPLKQKWRKLVKKWRIENDGKDITKFNLPTALHSLLVNNEAFANNVRAGFSTCGLYPFGDFVNYKRVVQSTSNTNVKYDAVPKSVISESSYLTYLESKIDPSLLKDFYLTCESGTDWEGKKEAIMLYDTWLAFKNDTTNHAVAAVSKDIDDSPLFDLCGINDIANEMHTPNKEISAKDPSTNNAVHSNGIENPGLPASFLINGDKNNSDTELSLNPAHPSASAFTALNKNDVTRQMDTPKNYNNINEPSTSHEALSKDIEDCLPTSFLETDEKDGFARQMHTPNKNNSNTASSSPDATSNVVESVATPNCTEQAGSTKESTKDKIVSNLVRDCVLWPEKIIPKSTKKAKYIPSVLTSDKWMEIMQSTEKEKKNKEPNPKIGNKRAKSLKKGPCVESKAKKLKTIAKHSKISVKKKNTYRSDSEESSEKCDNFSVHDTDDSIGEDVSNDCDDQENKNIYKIGDFVIFVYEGEYFVGQIQFLNEEEVQIKSMQKTAKNWKWPDRVDLNFYPYDDIKQKIATPKKVSKRDVYRVPEIEKYWEFST